MGVTRIALGVAMLISAAVAARAEGISSCNKPIATEQEAIDHAKQLFAKQLKLIRRIGGAGIKRIEKNLSGDCCEAVKDQRGWHVDLLDRRENPRTVFAFSFDACGKAIESRHADK